MLARGFLFTPLFIIELNNFLLTDSNDSYIVTIMNSQENLIKSFREICRKKKFRITPQRIAVYEVLINDYTHPSVDDVYRKVAEKYPNISFDTVYRTMLSFSDIGIIRVTENCGGRKRFDVMTERHHHLHCTSCGKIVDFFNKEYDEIKIPQKIISKYKVTGKKVVLDYLCKSCKKK